MKPCFIFFCLIAGLWNAPADLPPVWMQFSSSPSGTVRHDDINFADENTGFAVRGNGLIHRTTDGGETWVQKLQKTGTHFRCIGFASPTRGWAGNLGVGSYDSTVTDTNVMYQTLDGGESWNAVPGLAEAGVKGLCALQVLDEKHIFAAGRVRGPAHFIKSADGGTNWSVVSLTQLGVMNGIMDVYFHDATNGYVVGMDNNPYSTNCAGFYQGAIARTTNAGLSWSLVATSSVACSYFWKMSWPSRNVGYATLQQNGSYSNVVFFKTVDGGATWTSNAIPLSAIGASSFFLQSVGFASETEGWLGGSSNTSPTNFLHTTDGGATWSLAGYSNSRSINRIRFLNSKLGFASGQKLHIYRSPLAITTHPQSQWLSPGSTAILSINTSGNPPFNYLWKKDGVPVNGATNSTLTLTNMQRATAGAYSVTVTNTFGQVISSNAMLRILMPQQLNTPEITGDFLKLTFGDADGQPLTSNQLAGFIVQASTNLLHWTPLTNQLTLTNGLMFLEDAVNFPQRFFRVLEP